MHGRLDLEGDQFCSRGGRGTRASRLHARIPEPGVQHGRREDARTYGPELERAARSTIAAWLDAVEKPTSPA